MQKKWLLLFCALSLVTCTDSKHDPTDCAAVLCMAASDTLILYFYDTTESSNRLDDETIDATTIEIRDGNNAIVDYTVEGPTNLGKYIAVAVPAKPYGPKQLNITFDGGEPFTISFITSLSDDSECCGPYTALDDIEATVYTLKPTVSYLLPLNLTLLID
jgi:hypothetical protein